MSRKITLDSKFYFFRIRTVFPWYAVPLWDLTKATFDRDCCRKISNVFSILAFGVSDEWTVFIFSPWMSLRLDSPLIHSLCVSPDFPCPAKVEYIHADIKMFDIGGSCIDKVRARFIFYRAGREYFGLFDSTPFRDMPSTSVPEYIF